jgi:hypothetical protein
MKTPKQRYINIIEKYLNVLKKDQVELMYGEGTKIKIHTLNPSVTTNSILVEAVIVLGGNINEDVLDRSLADYLIQDIVYLIFPDSNVKCMVRWDV